MQGGEGKRMRPTPIRAWRGANEMTAGSGERQQAPYGRALWDADKKARLFAEVVKTTEMAKSAGLLDRTKDGKSEQTLRLYARLARSRVDVMAADGGRLMDGVTAQSWHTVRAAVLHRLAEEYRNWRKVGDKASDFAEAVNAARATRRAAILFDKVSKMERPDREARQSLSKGRTLPAPLLSWQEQVMAASTPAQRPFVALMWATGCRPAEIERGVTVRRVDGGIEIEIPGAKVTAVNGQPRRKILIDARSPAGLHLGIALGARQEIEMSRKAKRIGNDFADIRRRTGLAAVSAYSFRHQVSADLKAAGVEKKAIAQVLGHASERTQGRYGRPSKGRAGGGIILDAIGSRPVRTGRPETGPDTTLEV